MVHTDDDLREVTMVFDGSRSVLVERERGGPVEVEIDCRAREKKATE